MRRVYRIVATMNTDTTTAELLGLELQAFRRNRRHDDPKPAGSALDVIAQIRRDMYNFGRRSGDVVADVRANYTDRAPINSALTVDGNGNGE